MGVQMRGAKCFAAFVACLTVSATLLVLLPTDVEAAAWKTNVRVNDLSIAPQQNPKIAVGPDGLLHVVWVGAMDGAADPDIYYSASGNNGTSFFYPNTEVSKDAQNNYTQGSPDITVDGNGTAFVVWSEFQGLDNNIKAARKSPSADSFEALGLINKVVNGAQGNPSIASHGTRIAIAWKDERSDNNVRIWNSTTGALVREMSGHRGSVTSVDYSPDGSKVASASEDGVVKIWNANTGALLKNITGHSSVVSCVAWSPNGMSIASGSWDYTVKVWDATTYALQNTLVNSKNPVNSLEWSPNGTLIAVGHNGEGNYAGTGGAPDGTPSQHFNVTLWNVPTTAPHYLGQHTNSVASVAFSADGKLLASSSIDGSAMVWNATSGNYLNTIYSAGGAVNAVSWGPNNTLAAGLGNGTIDVYAAPNLNSTISKSIPSHRGSVKSLDWQAGRDRLASSSADSTAKIRVASTGVAVADTGRMANTAHSVRLSPNGANFATGSGNSILYHKSESHVWCAVSENGGSTWPVQTRVDTVGAFELGSPSIAVGANGDIGVAWYESRAGGLPNIYYSNSTDGGISFAADTRISSGAGRKFVPSLAMDAAGVGYMVWHDERDKLATERFDIYYGSSDAPLANLRVNATGATVQQQNADIGVSDDGLTVAICWREENIVNSIKVTRSTNGGASFLAPDVVSDVVEGTRWLPSMCLDRGQVHIVWEDYRRGTPNIYFSTTVLSDSWPPSIRGVSPTPGSASVSAYSPIEVRFNEPVNQASLISAFQIKTGGSTWAGSQMVANWSAYGDRVSLEPSGWHLSYFTTYTVTIASSVTDLAGNAMTTPYSWSFTTGSDVDGPRIGLVSAPISVVYDEPSTIIASVYDITGVSTAMLYYKLNGTASFLSVPMATNSAMNYEASIPAQWVLGTLLFYVWSNDTLGNIGTLPSNLSAGQYLEIYIFDDKAPQLTSVGIGTVEFDASATVNVTAVDDIGIQAVYLEYNTVLSDITHVSTMTHVAGDGYTGTLPAQGEIGMFGYRVVAVDTSNNTGATDYYTVQSVDSFAPELSAPVAAQQDDGSILITVTATDNHDLESVSLHFVPVGGSRYIEKEMSPGAAGTYSASILKQEQSGTFKYYVNATDPSGNTASTLVMNDGKPYSMWVDGKLPPTSVILVVSIVIIVVGLAALVYMLRRRRMRPKQKSGIVGQPEHPLESVNTPVSVPKKPDAARPGTGKPPKAG
jgi:WD40 repeat protein